MSDVDPKPDPHLNPSTPKPSLAPWRLKTHEVIFEAHTFWGKVFDILLLVAICISVAVVMIDSVSEYNAKWGGLLWRIEVALTLLFTAEYALRLICVRQPSKYALSFFGVVDLLAILPTYLSFFIAGSQALVVVRTLRLIRVFRVLELGSYAIEAQTLLYALNRTRAKIVVFLLFVVTLVMITGTLMFFVEGDEPNTQFTNIPTSVYWAIVTMTTVGYGDIAPQTGVGQFLAAVAMIVGYSIIIVPMGIFSAEVATVQARGVSGQVCPGCTLEGHDADARYCKRCGNKL